MRFFSGDLPRITVRDLAPDARGGRRRLRFVDLELFTGARLRLRLEHVRLTFGWRTYVTCPGCERRARFLYLVSEKVLCTICAGIRYRGRIYSRARHWKAWGRWIEPLRRVQAELAKRGLRLARRGRLERRRDELLRRIEEGIRKVEAPGIDEEDPAAEPTE